MKNYGCIEVAGQWPENSWKSMAALLTPCVPQILCDAHHLLRAWAVMLVYKNCACKCYEARVLFLARKDRLTADSNVCSSG